MVITALAPDLWLGILIRARSGRGLGEIDPQALALVCMEPLAQHCWFWHVGPPDGKRNSTARDRDGGAVERHDLAFD
jgi:hypothetical protein